MIMQPPNAVDDCNMWLDCAKNLTDYVNNKSEVINSFSKLKAYLRELKFSEVQN